MANRDCFNNQSFRSRLVGTEKYTNWTLSGESEDIPNFKFEVRIVMYRD